MFYTHLAGRINGGMTLNSVIKVHNLIEKPSSEALMGQVSEEKTLVVQVEGQDAIWMTI